MRAGDWEEALARWETVRARFPKLGVGYRRAAEAARNLGLHREARKLILSHQYGSEVFDTPLAAPAPKRHGRLSLLLELIWTKALFNLRSEVHHNYLSYAWWVLEPLLHMAVYYVVFGLLLQRGGENYPVFLLTGLIPWMWFSKSVSNSSGSILRGQQLMIQVGLPAIVFPLVSVLQITLKQLPVFAVLLGFLWLQGYAPGAHWWGLLPVLLVHVLIMTAVACAVAAVIPFVRDLGYLVPTGLMFLMFCSGVFYDYRIVAPQWQELFLLNPVAFLLKSYREILIEGVAPELQTLGLWAFGAGLACTLILLMYERLRYVYPRIVME
jgi:lipopolysaccharide transport system permease protein